MIRCVSGNTGRDTIQGCSSGTIQVEVIKIPFEMVRLEWRRCNEPPVVILQYE